MGSPSKLVHRPLPQDDPIECCPDITLARWALARQPRTGPDEVLKMTIDYFRTMLLERASPAAT